MAADASAPARLIERAPAKINLSLHVLGRRADGFHELESLAAFTRFGDTLALNPGEALTIDVSGPRASDAGPAQDNLVLRAARALEALVPGLRMGAFHLYKTLPAAAGIGGGSSDAAAALRLLARANGLPPDDPRLLAAAQATGSDVPVCLGARARMMRGRGEAVSAPLVLPPLCTILVNPGISVETRAVFTAMGLKPGEDFGFGSHPAIAQESDAQALIAALKRARNDLEDFATLGAPVINHVIAVIAAARGCRLARMSGSGATCFGLFETRRAASAAAAVIRRDHPGWWVRAAVLH